MKCVVVIRLVVNILNKQKCYVILQSGEMCGHCRRYINVLLYVLLLCDRDAIIPCAACCQ